MDEEAKQNAESRWWNNVKCGAKAESSSPLNAQIAVFLLLWLLSGRN
jgi:hypothetical protein